jgi:hypothetical protein
MLGLLQPLLSTRKDMVATVMVLLFPAFQGHSLPPRPLPVPGLCVAVCHPREGLWLRFSVYWGQKHRRRQKHRLLFWNTEPSVSSPPFCVGMVGLCQARGTCAQVRSRHQRI